MSAPNLYALVKRAGDRVGGLTALAALAGISLSAMLRGAKDRKLRADTLLAIAEAAGEDPGLVLRAAGRAQVAERIERLYGRAGALLSDDDRWFAGLDPEVKRQIRRLVSTLDEFREP